MNEYVGLPLSSAHSRIGDDGSYRLSFVEVEESDAWNSRTPGPGRDPSVGSAPWWAKPQTIREASPHGSLVGRVLWHPGGGDRQRDAAMKRGLALPLLTT